MTTTRIFRLKCRLGNYGRNTRQIVSCKILLPILSSILLFSYYYVHYSNQYAIEKNKYHVVMDNREDLWRYIEDSLEESLKEDKGTGCNMPKLDPFDNVSTQFDEAVEPMRCPAETDWVKCYKSNCRIIYNNVRCKFRDIIYESDDKEWLGPAQTLVSGELFTFVKSDHVKINCETNINIFMWLLNKAIMSKNTKIVRTWEGYGVGFRKVVRPIRPPAGRENTLNVMILILDSTSKNGFIRKMPKTYKVLTEELGATILDSYNIVGDSTTATLLPLLTGKTELELPQVSRSARGAYHTDELPLLFYKLNKDGYRTAFFEDMVGIGTFNLRFTGFLKQPTDHYLRPFYKVVDYGQMLDPSPLTRLCVGDTPSFQLMLNITEQFLQLEGKRFALTFISAVSHDDFNFIVWTDDATAAFLQRFKSQGYVKDTLLILMGDHGPRYAAARGTIVGKLEERLPLVSIRLPDKLRQSRPEAQMALESNKDVLTSPHDIHATLLDVLDMTEYWNPYKVKGADLPRAMTLFRPIPKNRSCSEAGIQPHWCACVNWDHVPKYNPIYKRVAEAFVNYINMQTKFLRSKCAKLELKAIHSVVKRRINPKMLTFAGSNYDEYIVGVFSHNMTYPRLIYQVTVEVTPGSGMFEATVVHVVNEDAIVVNEREISRINRYNDDPECIRETYPNLNMFCYCVYEETKDTKSTRLL